ncbi:exopolyphosphatase, partial [Bacillus sp. P1(2020)]|nr:exopolyphosphatase [Pallidibacillus pasinlerensis]
LGKYIDTESSSQHTFYLLANRTIDGLMHKERLKLALVASYKNKTLFKQFIKPFTDWLSKAEQETLQLLGAMVKFTYSLDATKRQAIKDIKVEIVEKNIMITCFSKKEAMAEQYEAEKNKKQLEKTLKQDIQLLFY